MSSFIKLPTEKVIVLCTDFFKKENDRIAKEVVSYREDLVIKRRFFGLLKPKYKKEEVDTWELPTIYDSMAFQTIYPHHKISELLLSADLAKINGIDSMLVDASLFHYLDGIKGSGW